MRTPLAVIKGKVELLTKSLNNISNDELFHISKIMSELRRLEKMNSDLLLLAKEDIGESNNLKEFYLEDMVGDIRGFYTDMAEIKDKIFNIYSNTNIQVLWDYDKVKRVLIILIENAFKYTGEKGIITVVFEENYKNINVHVKDNGIGIKKEDQERIFDRFFRTENVRGNNIEGSGIGLSLLKSLCKSLNIEVVVNSEFRKGSEFILLIPKIMNL
ncbi:MAG: HAMP domain-containing histidine kinase [Clostridium sp.]|nr:HAMP domain-containing histidine kinase [Clostridium sp.]